MHRPPVLVLIPFAPDHFPTLTSWFATEGELVRWGGPMVAFPLDAPQLQAMLDERRGEPPARLCWMAVQGDETVGHVQLAFDWRHGNARLSRVAVAPGLRGRSLATPMLRLALDEAFGCPTIERVELNVYSWNAPAIRAYRRLGFIAEGTRRSSVRVGAERWDTAVMGLLRAEWAHGRDCEP